MNINTNLKIIVVTDNIRNTYLNLILHNLKLYFYLDIKYFKYEQITIKALSETNDIVIFDETAIDEIENLNLLFLRSMNRFIKFIYLTQILTEKIEERLYLASIDFIIRKNFIFTKIPPRLSHCINLILNQKNHFQILWIKNYQINIFEKTVLINKQKKRLSSKEFLIIFYLYSQNGTYLTRNKIFKNVWGYDDDDSSRLVDQNIFNIRKILGSDFIISKYKKGYAIIL